jgi:hypothetical protein
LSFADDEEFSAFLSMDHMLPAITEETVTDALKGFPLSLLPDRDVEWLAMAVRRSLAITLRSVGDGPERTSDADLRAELERLAGLVESTWLELFQCDQAADSRLWEYSLRHWDGQGGTEIADGIVTGEPSDYRHFRETLGQLEWMASFMRAAARSIDVPRKQWRIPERKSLRIERGRYLAPIFEAAYGREVSANNWPSGANQKPSAFMDFYQRMVALAFGEKSTPNLSGVLKAACQIHRQDPVKFAEGFISTL